MQRGDTGEVKSLRLVRKVCTDTQKDDPEQGNPAVIPRGDLPVQDPKRQIDDPVDQHKLLVHPGGQRVLGEIDHDQKQGEGSPVEMLPPVKQKDRGVKQRCYDRQDDLEPHRRCICSFLAEICDAEACRADK